MTNPVRVTQSDVARDTQLCLDAAARLAFPDGTVSAATLRAEAARGKLAIFRIGKKYYTTLGAIERMIELCPVQPKEPACTSDAAPDVNRNGPSETEATKSAQAALKISMEKLKKNSPPISPPSTAQTSATVIRPEFPSPTSSRSTPRKEPR